MVCPALELGKLVVLAADFSHRILVRGDKGVYTS
jgi:hypothetical protein